MLLRLRGLRQSLGRGVLGALDNELQLSMEVPGSVFLLQATGMGGRFCLLSRAPATSILDRVSESLSRFGDFFRIDYFRFSVEGRVE